MIVIVDERETVTDGFASWFQREGISAIGLAPDDFGNWMRTAPNGDFGAVEAFLVGGCAGRVGLAQVIRSRSDAAVIAVIDEKSLEETLSLFASGVDDVVRKPVHVREILARITAIRRRARGEADSTTVGEVCVYRACHPGGTDGASAGGCAGSIRKPVSPVRSSSNARRMPSGTTRACTRTSLTVDTSTRARAA